jgi:hypothetical protein
MRFIVTSDCRNTHKLKDGEKVLPLHLEKGMEFDADEKDASVANILAQLGAAGRIVDVDNQPAAVKQIRAEVAATKAKAEKEAAKVVEKK